MIEDCLQFKIQGKEETNDERGGETIDERVETEQKGGEEREVTRLIKRLKGKKVLRVFKSLRFFNFRLPSFAFGLYR